MSLDFVQELETVGRRVARRQWTAAACWTMAGAILAALGLMAVDWWYGVFGLTARMLLTVTLALAVIAVCRAAAAVVGDPATALKVALDLEKQRPELQGLLSSGVEFSGQDPANPTAGSEELRRAVVLRAALTTDAIDVGEAAHRPSLRKPIAAMIAAVVVLVAVAMWWPQGVAVGAARLLNPLNRLEWPRKHDLAFIDAPAIVAVGGDFQAQLVDQRGDMPGHIEVEYRSLRQGRWQYETQRYSQPGRQVAVVWPNVQGSFEFRARGGDHLNMSWQRVDAENAPQLTAIKVIVHPPSYTGWSAKPIDDPFRVLEGSALEFAAQATALVNAGQLVGDGQPSVSLTVGSDGKTLKAPAGMWRPRRSGRWAVKLTTPTGLTTVADRQLPIEIAPDAPPLAAIVDPLDEQQLLPSARLSLKLASSDDVGLDRVAVAVQEIRPTGGAAAAKSIELFQASDDAERGSVLNHEVQHVLDLSTLDARSGSVWEIVAVATDSAGQEARSSTPMRVRVITRDQFLRRVDEQLVRLRAALELAHNCQRDALTRVESWTAEAIGSPPGIDQGIAALAWQRRVASPLAGEQESAIPVTEALIADFHRNGLADDDTLPRLARILAALDELTRASLPVIETSMEQVVRRLELDNRSHPSASTIAEIVEGQRRSLETLASALRELAAWGELQQYRREIAELKLEQTVVKKATAAAAKTTLGETQAATTSNSRGQTQPIAAAERELATRLAVVLNRMRQDHAGLATQQLSLDGARIESALSVADRSQVQVQSHSAADHLAGQRFGQAVAAQVQVERALQQMLDELAGSGAKDATRRLSELKRAEKKLASLRRRTQALAAQQESAQKKGFNATPRKETSTAVVRRQLADAIGKLSNELNQMRATTAGQTTNRAAKDLMRPNPSSTTDKRAETQLQKAQQQLADERRQQQAQIAEQQLHLLAAVVKELVADQQEIVEAVAQLEKPVGEESSSSPRVSEDAVHWADRQRAAYQKTQRQARQLSVIPVFAHSLGIAAIAMHQAHEALTSGLGEDDVLRPATRALEQLVKLEESIRQQPPPPQPSNPSPGQPPPDGASPQQQAQAAQQARALQLAIAQLRLVRRMQADLEARTSEVEQSSESGSVTKAAWAAQAAALATEQRELVELARRVVRDADLPPIEEEQSP